jgi:endonuclease/exonuclease/phosphatase family metal-dependent hydrolase
MALFMEAAGLKSANRERLPSYPARRPRMELDFILHTRDIEIESFSVPVVTYSDHRPLVCDFRVTGEARAAA